MSTKNVSGIVPEYLHEMARAICEAEGLSMSALVSSALNLYLALPGAARRNARAVLASKDRSAQTLLVEGCGKAIARAGNQTVNAYLREKGKALGLQARPASESEIEAKSIRLVDEVRKAARSAEQEADVAGPAI